MHCQRAGSLTSNDCGATAATGATACLNALAKVAACRYEQDGFIHLTADPQLLVTVANHFYTSSQGDWIVLVIDSSKLSAEVRV